jgi:hypothetical protein
MAASTGQKNARSVKDKEMAADLRRRGIFHGKRLTKTHADPMQYLHPDLVGTARYRRLRSKA